MSSNTIIDCPECGSSYKTEFLFCPNCGTNLTLPERVKTKDEISYKVEISDKYLDAYIKVKNKIDELNYLDEKITQQEHHLNSLQGKIKIIRNQIKDQEKELENYKEELENFKGLSVSSFFSKITGTHERKLTEKEDQLLEKINNLDALKEQEQRMIKQINNAEKDLQDLRETNEIRERLKNKLVEIVHRATEGIIDPAEDEIEMKISRLGAKIDPYIDQKSKFQNSISYLQMAQEFLRQATLNLDADHGETMKSNALLMDTLTKSEVSHIKNDVKQATNFIEQAYDLLKESGYKDEHTREEAFEGMWQRFIQNFIRDLKSGFRTKEKTKNQLTKSIADVNKLMSWVQSKLNTINFKLDELMEELRSYEKDLTKERMRIIKEAVRNQN